VKALFSYSKQLTVQTKRESYPMFDFVRAIQWRKEAEKFQKRAKGNILISAPWIFVILYNDQPFIPGQYDDGISIQAIYTATT